MQRYRVAWTRRFRDIQPLIVAFFLWSLPVRAAPPDLSGLGYQQQPGAALPLQRSFHDDSGRAVTLGEAIGKRPTLLILGYYACPSLCGVIRDDALSAISRASLVAGKDYTLVFLSIDPTETPAMAASAKAADLRDYPTGGAEIGWRFLTGEPADVAAVEASTGFHSRYSAELKQFLHPAGLVVLTPTGHVADYLLGVGFRPADVETAIKRASLGRVEQSDNPVLLLCFHYDPSVGRYSLDIIKVLRLAGMMTIAGILGIVYLLHRRAKLMQ